MFAPYNETSQTRRKAVQDWLYLDNIRLCYLRADHVRQLFSSAKLRYLLCLVFLLVFAPGHGRAQDRPYFVSYSHDMEDPGELDIESKTAIAGTRNPFAAMATESEFGVRSWWTAGFYLDGQVTDEDSAIYTGFRIENRLKPWKGEHIVNPILYVEYENISGADKTILEFVGHDAEDDMNGANDVARRKHQHEGEFRLILSSNVHTWNFAENFIAEKDLGHSPWEFGYALGVSRPLRAVSVSPCTLCGSKFVAGVEMYGGAGDTRSLTVRDTSHYVAPALGWNTSSRTRVSVSTAFGVSGSSLRCVFRAGFVYEFHTLSSWFRDSR